jgi:hypothetical protein
VSALEHSDSYAAARPGRSGKRRILVALSIAVAIGLAAFANAYFAGFNRGRNEAMVQSFGASCVASANRTIERGGSDPETPDMKQRIGTYCGCMLMAMQAQFTPAEFASVAARGGNSLAKDEKLNAVVKKCARAAGAG